MKGLFLFVFIQHPGKMIKIRTGELAHRDVFDHFSGADKARVEPTGLEPMTSRTSSGRSSQLSYGSV